MVLLLHFLGGNHMSYALSAMPQLADWAEKLGVIVVMPLARGEGGWYEGEAEKDVFEAWRDVAAHYSVDPDRVYLTGMSMGGFGTWRLGQLYPDLFARGIVWAGPMIPNGVWAYPQDPPAPSCGDDQPPDCGYNLMDLFGNTRDLPLFVVHGGADELVPSTGAEHWMADYATGGHATYRYLFYPDRSHETSFPASTEPWVLRWLDGLPARDTDPVTVTYRLDRRFFQPRLGIQYTRAYWVHGLALAPDATTGRIDATRSTGTDTTTVLPDSYGADALGPYRLRGNDVTPPPVDPDYVHVELAHISRAILDTRRMGWSGGAQRVVGDTDSPVDLILEESSAGPAAVLGAAATQSGDSVTLHLGSGHFDVTVTPGAAAAADRARALQKARRAALRLRARLAVRGRRRALLVVSGGAPAGARVVVRLRLGGRTVARRRTTARRGLFRVRIRVRRAGRYRALVAATTPEGVRLTARTRAARALRPPARARARPSRSRRAR
jgi:predicted esterase